MPCALGLALSAYGSSHVERISMTFAHRTLKRIEILGYDHASLWDEDEILATLDGLVPGCGRSVASGSGDEAVPAPGVAASQIGPSAAGGRADLPLRICAGLAHWRGDESMASGAHRKS